MLTSEGLRAASFTAAPVTIGKWTLTIEDLIKMTTAADWDSWVLLTPAGADRVARILNVAKPWKRHRTAALTDRPAVIDSYVVSVSES